MVSCACVLAVLVFLCENTVCRQANNFYGLTGWRALSNVLIKLASCSVGLVEGILHGLGRPYMISLLVS